MTRIEEIRERLRKATEAPTLREMPNEGMRPASEEAILDAAADQLNQRTDDGNFLLAALTASEARVRELGKIAEDLQDQCLALAEERLGLRQHNAKLRAALEPFAAVKLLKPSISDDRDSIELSEVRLQGFAIESATAYLPVTAFRAAAEALKGEG